MKNFILSVLLLVLAGELITLFVMNRKTPRETVLAEATTVATATPFVSPKPSAKAETPTPIPTIKPSIHPTMQPVSSQQIYEFINRFAGQYGVSPDVMRHIALCESDFNPLAQTSKYAGLFQFDTTTWKNLRKEIGEETDPNLRLNAEEAIQTAAYAISKGKKNILWPNCFP